MHTPRRKSPLAPPEPFKHGRKSGSLPIFVVVVSIFLFAMVMYSEDIRSLAESSFGRFRSLDLLPQRFYDPGYETEHGDSNDDGQSRQRKRTRSTDAVIHGEIPPAAVAEE